MSKYRKCWESKTFLKEWIQEVPDDNTKAYCKACKIKLYAHRYSVLKHTATKKHQDNYQKLLNNQKECHQNLLSTSSVKKDKFPAIKILNESPGIDVNEKMPKNAQEEYLFEEAVIEGDELVYNESIDIFIDSPPKDEKKSLLLAIEDKSETITITRTESDEYNEILSESDHIEELMSHSSTETRTISSHILDTSVGRAVANVEITIYRLENDYWNQLNHAKTNEDGRCSQLVPLNEFTTGIYKLHFNVRPYFAANNVQSFYPFIEIVVDCKQGEHYHIPLLLNPFGYSTYRGT